METPKTPKIALRERFELKRHQSIKEDELLHKRSEFKNQDLEEAIMWCKENGCRGYAALNTGLFPSIKSPLTINAYLDGKRTLGKQKQYQHILTKHEEEVFVRYLCNKNRCCQGLTEAAASDIAINILKVRVDVNKRGGRKFIPLSKQAKKALSDKKVGRRFFQRLKIAHNNLIMKSPKSLEINRGLNITREMAENHLDDLAMEINLAGIGDLKREAPGVWYGVIDGRRIIFHDETPQMVNHGPDVFSKTKVFGNSS